MFALLTASVLCTGDVNLDDAYRFGVCRGICECNRATCALHLEAVVKKFENEAARMAWWWRQDQVLESWDCLYRALDETIHPSKRLDSLSRLRMLIGVDNYNTGRMYAPVPDYGPWKPVK